MSAPAFDPIDESFARKKVHVWCFVKDKPLDLGVFSWDQVGMFSADNQLEWDASNEVVVITNVSDWKAVVDFKRFWSLPMQPVCPVQDVPRNAGSISVPSLPDTQPMTYDSGDDSSISDTIILPNTMSMPNDIHRSPLNNNVMVAPTSLSPGGSGGGDSDGSSGDSDGSVGTSGSGGYAGTVGSGGFARSDGSSARSGSSGGGRQSCRPKVVRRFQGGANRCSSGSV